MSPSALKIHLKSIISQMMSKYMRLRAEVRSRHFSSFLEDAHSHLHVWICEIKWHEINGVPE
jgi:hypothetical protein